MSEPPMTLDHRFFPQGGFTASFKVVNSKDRIYNNANSGTESQANSMKFNPPITACKIQPRSASAAILEKREHICFESNVTPTNQPKM